MNLRAEIDRVVGRGLAAGLLGLAAGVMFTLSPVAAQQATQLAPGAAGMTVHIDRQSGQLRRTPGPDTTPLQLSVEERNAMSTAHEGLVQEPGTQPGGGVKLDLQGRFQSPLIATIDANGNVKIQHLTAPPADK